MLKPLKVCTVCGARWRGEPAVCPLDGGALEDHFPSLRYGDYAVESYERAYRCGDLGAVLEHLARSGSGRIACVVVGMDLGLTARIDHENVRRVEATGVEGEIPWARVEPLATTLDDVEEYLPSEAVLPIARGVARALEAAHSKGWAHLALSRSLIGSVDDFGKPEHIRVWGFGRSDVSVPKPKDCRVFDLHGPAAPEQFSGREPNPSVDAYRWARVMNNLLGGTPQAVAFAATKRLASLLKGGLNRDPASRPSMREIVERLG